MEPGSEPSEHGALYIGHNFPPRLPGGEVRTGWLTIENLSRTAWQRDTVKVSIDLDGTRVFLLELPHSVDPGQRVTLHWVFRTASEIGRHEFKVDLIDQEGMAFEQ